MRKITSFRNPAIRRYRDLDDPRERRVLGLAAAEGIRILHEALLSDVDLTQVFLSDRARRGPEGEALMARLEAGESAGRWECFEVPGEILERMAFTENPQGAIAIFRPKSFTLDAVIKAGNEPVVFLDRLADPGNLGLILRTAEAAQAAGIVITPGTVDPLNPKCIRAGAGSIFRIPVARADLATAITAAQAAGYRFFATSPRGGRDYLAADLTGKVGFLLGPEGSGLESGVIESFESVRIPTGRVESLNVAMAAGILLYEARRRRLSGSSTLTHS